jgi:hypothetical protein
MKATLFESVVLVVAGAGITYVFSLLLQKRKQGVEELFKQRVALAIATVEMLWKDIMRDMMENYRKAIREAYSAELSDKDVEKMVEAILQLLKTAMFASDRTLRDWHKSFTSVLEQLFGISPEAIVQLLRQGMPEPLLESFGEVTRAIRRDLGIGRLSPFVLVKGII